MTQLALIDRWQVYTTTNQILRDCLAGAIAWEDIRAAADRMVEIAVADYQREHPRPKGRSVRVCEACGGWSRNGRVCRSCKRFWGGPDPMPLWMRHAVNLAANHPRNKGWASGGWNPRNIEYHKHSIPDQRPRSLPLVEG